MPRTVYRPTAAACSISVHSSSSASTRSGWRRGREAVAATKLTVYPKIVRIVALPHSAGEDPLAGSTTPTAIGQAGDDFFALRPYEIGDDLRRVHWPSVARTGELVIRQNELPWQGRVTVVVDLRDRVHSAASLEDVLSAAASVVTACAAEHSLVRLLTTAPIDTGFGAGRAHVDGVLERLAAAAVHAAEAGALGTLVHSAARARTSSGALCVITTFAGAAEVLGAPGGTGRGARRDDGDLQPARAGGASRRAVDLVVARAARGDRGGRGGHRWVRGRVERRVRAGGAPGAATAHADSVARPVVTAPTERRELYPYATAALVALDLVAAATLGRLFVPGDALGPVLIAVLAGHGAALLSRYRGWSGVTTSAVAPATSVLAVAWLVFPETTFYGLPGADTWSAATNALGEARRSFGVVVAPTIATPGFRLACVFAVALFAAIADWGAFRVGVTIEAAVPAFTLFVFTSVLSTAEHRAAAARVRGRTGGLARRPQRRVRVRESRGLPGRGSPARGRSCVAASVLG